MLTDGPLIALDVDGVLNAYLGNPAKLSRQGFVKHRKVQADNGRFDLWLNPSNGPQLLELAEDLGAELVWATSWNEYANEQISPRIGLPELPVITVTSPFRVKPGPIWKAHEVLAATVGHPLVWFDDEFTQDDYQWSTDREWPTKLIRTIDHVGITTHHLDEVRKWWKNV